MEADRRREKADLRLHDEIEGLLPEVAPHLLERRALTQAQ